MGDWLFVGLFKDCLAFAVTIIFKQTNFSGVNGNFPV